ncbi:MAG: slipin family protein [Flavobacteriales bacterium]|nr:slipin family protein [Flavobacteriales bacterium]
MQWNSRARSILLLERSKDVYCHPCGSKIYSIELSGQEILTRDKATIRLTVFANYRVVDMMKAITENKEFEKQVYVLIQLVLREFVGNLTIDQILEVREKLTDSITEQVTHQLERLGIELLGLGIRDIILPGDMKEIMNQVIMAEKKAQANVIMRREETASTRSLLNTAKIMEENQMVWKLKEMEYVERIAERVSNIQLNATGTLTEQLKNLFVNKNNNS